jgi:hypothetical protein
MRAGAVACAAALAVASIAAADPGPTPPLQGDALRLAVRHIKNVCFATYPPFVDVTTLPPPPP